MSDSEILLDLDPHSDRDFPIYDDGSWLELLPNPLLLLSDGSLLIFDNGDRPLRRMRKGIHMPIYENLREQDVEDCVPLYGGVHSLYNNSKLLSFVLTMVSILDIREVIQQNWKLKLQHQLKTVFYHLQYPE